MIAAFIVIASIVLAVAFIIAWIVKPDFRKQVESPKYAFQEQVERYNRQTQEDSRDAVPRGTNES